MLPPHPKLWWRWIGIMKAHDAFKCVTEVWATGPYRSLKISLFRMRLANLTVLSKAEVPTNCKQPVPNHTFQCSCGIQLCIGGKNQHVATLIDFWTGIAASKCNTDRKEYMYLSLFFLLGDWALPEEENHLIAVFWQLIFPDVIQLDTGTLT